MNYVKWKTEGRSRPSVLNIIRLLLYKRILESDIIEEDIISSC